jgi:LPS export ABC transporter protein LptC
MRRHITSALLAVIGSACAQVATTPAQRKIEAAESSDLVLRDARLIRLVDGKTIARVSAAELRYHREGGRFEADQVRATLLPGPQAKALESFGAVEVRAPKVTGDSTSKDAHGEGGVSADSARGDHAKGESIDWHGDAKLLQSEHAVSIEGAGYTLRGGSLIASADGERFELSNGAGGTLSQKAVPPAADLSATLPRKASR